jgi:serine phosphatase RsbU (regulator of sigma subunit)
MKKILDVLFGKMNEFTFENRVFNAIIFVTVLQCIIAVVWNITLGMPAYLIITIIVIGIICSIFYYYSRIKKKFNAFSYLILACILLSVVWFVNEGSKGATPFLFLTTSAGIICISKKNRHLLFLAVILTTICILYYLETNFYDYLMHGHHSEVARESDIIFFFILDLILIYFIVSFLKENFDKENKIILSQKEILNQQNEKIVSSIKSAEFIQGALLPNDTYLKTVFPDYFVFYKPKDIVSGDFYWVNSINDTTIFVAADCTGHGVTGALMSMLGIAYLNEIVVKNPDSPPGIFLDELREKIKSALNQPDTKTTISYGMDISMCCLNTKNKTLQFAGANNPLYLIRNKQFIEYKADKMPIGLYPKEQPFTTQIINVEQNDVFYICSDGFEDQFGMNKKRFSKKQFKALLFDIHENTMNQQQEFLEIGLNKWKENEEQTDDILIIGIRV